MSWIRHGRIEYYSTTVMTPEGDIFTTGWTSVGINTNRVPSKAMGRKGTRRAYKRKHPPGWFFRFFEGIES